MKAKIRLRIHLGNNIGRKFLSDHFRSWAKRPGARFEHSVNVQLPILSAFWGDAGNLALPVGQERSRNIYVHVHPMGTTMTSQMNPRHRDWKNIKEYKHTEPAGSLGKAVIMLNCLTSLKLFFCCKTEIVWLSAVFCRTAYSFVSKVEKDPIPASFSVCKCGHLAVPSQSLC